jgi:uncharacterized protein YdaU (DUF1376 family)
MKLKWFTFYASEFIVATVGLSCLERAEYALMLVFYYEVGPFPSDTVLVHRIIGCKTDEQKRAVDYVLDKFFVLTDGHWHHGHWYNERVAI